MAIFDSNRKKYKLFAAYSVRHDSSAFPIENTIRIRNVRKCDKYCDKNHLYGCNSEIKSQL